MKTDILIAGGGIAGLSFALKASNSFPNKKINILFKETPKESNTLYAQGGIVGVFPDSGDQVSDHVKDTLIAGDNTNMLDIVQMVSEYSPQAIEDLIMWGVNFDKNIKGDYETLLEGGHSKRRIFHYKDCTGQQIQLALIKEAQNRDNIFFLHQTFLLDIWKDNNRVYGGYFYDSKLDECVLCKSDIVILATGGLGQIYGCTTNPKVATGDGLAIAIRHGIKVNFMPYIQFHPTALYQKDLTRLFLITEAVRGEGGLLKNHKGDYFMKNYDYRLELAPRDIVARAIFTEMEKEKMSYQWLDVSKVLDFEKKFPTISQYCISQGIYWQEKGIPITVAAHYHCGGIDVDSYGQSSLTGLFVIGEAAFTGLHGSNRLASNSLLEAVVYAHRTNEYLKINYPKKLKPSIFNSPFYNVNYKKNDDPKAQFFKEQLKKIMDTNMGVQKTNNSIYKASIAIEKIQKELKPYLKKEPISLLFIECDNLLKVAQKIVFDSMQETQNSGVFYVKELV